MLPTRPMRSDKHDLELFNECFGRNDRRRSEESLEWQYARNPTGRVFVDIAQPENEDRIAAIYASLPVRMRIDGRVRLALQSLDTLTDADFRGRGLFVSLAKGVFARATEDGAALIYGFPNSNSAHGFFKKLGWTNLDPIPFLVRPLNARYVAARLKLEKYTSLVPDVSLYRRIVPSPRGLEIRHVDRFDPAFDRLWAEYAADIGIAVERNAAYLNWRLVDKPGQEYERLAAYEGGTLVGFVAFCTEAKHGGRVGYLMELLHAPGHRRAGRRLLGDAVGQMKAAGADVVLAWSFSHSPNFRTLLSLGFVPFPERFRPIELHFGARAFDPALGARVLERRAWYLSYLDADTV